MVLAFLAVEHHFFTQIRLRKRTPKPARKLLFSLPGVTLQVYSVKNPVNFGPRFLDNESESLGPAWCPRISSSRASQWRRVRKIDNFLPLHHQYRLRPKSSTAHSHTVQYRHIQRIMTVSRSKRGLRACVMHAVRLRDANSQRSRQHSHGMAHDASMRHHEREHTSHRSKLPTMLRRRGRRHRHRKEGAHGAEERPIAQRGDLVHRLASASCSSRRLE